MQFVTFRLGDALPASRVRAYVEQREVWLGNHPKPWSVAVEAAFQRKFTWKLEKWLDEGAGGCLLRDPDARKILMETMMKYQGERVEHHAIVIMPNHVHLVFSPMERLAKLIGAWKSVSAQRIGKGSVWQRNYRDTLIRDGGHFANAVRYIRKNPAKAKLREGEFTLWESERANSVK